MSFWKNMFSEDNFFVSGTSFLRPLTDVMTSILECCFGKKPQSLKERSIKTPSLKKRLELRGAALSSQSLKDTESLKDTASLRDSGSKYDSQPKQFCLWLVPAGSGSVKKLRFSARRALAVVSLVGVLTFGVVLLAGDYIRIQIVRVSEALSFADLQVRHAQLTAEADALFHRVAELKSERDRLESAQAAVRSRVLELKAVLGEIRAVDLVSRKNEVTRKNEIQKEQPLAKGGEQVAAATVGTQGVLGLQREGSDKQQGVVLDEEVGIGGEAGETALQAERKVDDDAAQADIGDEGIGGAEFVGEPSLLKGSQVSNGTAFRESGASLAEGRPSSWKLNNESVSRSQSDDAQAAFITDLDSFISRLKSFPIGYPGNGHINSEFGPRRSPFSNRYRLHQGVDLALPYGSPIFATAEGVVEKVKYHGSYGLVVEIRHTSGLVTRFAHLSKASVNEGEEICRGEVVGLVGNSGMSTGPHLHYEVLLDKKPVDPTPFMKFPTAVDLSSLL